MDPRQFHYIPEEYKRVALTFTSFVNIPTILEKDYGSKTLNWSRLIITKPDVLVELLDDQVKRVQSINICDVKKILVFHEFNPLKRFIVLLNESSMVYLLCYNTLKIINEWENIQDIYIIDNAMKSGEPQLKFKKSSGGDLYIEKESFIVRKEENSDAKIEAATAISNRIQMNVWQCETLKNEIEQKELFAKKKINDIRDAMRGQQNHNQSTAVNSSASNLRVGTETNSGFDIFSIRQRIFKDKWIISHSFCNRYDEFLISDPQIVLQSSSLHKLEYKTKLFKVFHLIPKSSSGGSNSTSEIEIVPFDPPVIKPRKKAYLVVVCSLPAFSLDGTISCQGLVTYNLLGTSSDSEKTWHQIPFPTVTLDFKDRRKHFLTLSHHEQGLKFPFDLLALIAVSVSHKLLLMTLVTPLETVENMLTQNKDFQKNGNFYYIDSVLSDPLHYCVVQWKREDNKIELTFYARSDTEAGLLTESLMQTLPNDCFLVPTLPDDKTDNQTEEPPSLLFLSKLNEVLDKIIDKAEINKSNSGSEPFDYSSRKIRLSALKNHLAMESKDYRHWRTLLHNMGNDIEKIYKQI